MYLSTVFLCFCGLILSVYCRSPSKIANNIDCNKRPCTIPFARSTRLHFKPTTMSAKIVPVKCPFGLQSGASCDNIECPVGYFCYIDICCKLAPGLKSRRPSSSSHHQAQTQTIVEPFFS